MNTKPLKEYKCFVSKKVLCRAAGEWQIEILNEDNRFTSYVWESRISQDIWPKWQAFQNLATDLRCKECKRLLGRAISIDSVVEIKCKHCHTINLFDVQVIENARLASLSVSQRALIVENKRRAMTKN